MPRRLVSATLVGRDRELASLVQALDRAEAGGPVHQLVSGEAGVGKSRLIAETMGIASARGMRVLFGACANIADGGVPYGPIVDALRTLVRDMDPDEVDALLGAWRTELARLVPSLSADPSADGTTQSEALQARLLDAVLGLLHRLADRSPVLLVIEDLHWADSATRETVAFLLRQVRTDRVLLLMTFRADELHRRHPLLPWLAEVDRSGRVERLDLDRLDATRTAALLASILGSDPTDDLVERIHRRSDGNPFFVEELLMSGQDGSPSGRLPPTLREVLLARIVALPETTQALIGVAAVAGRKVDHDLLARVVATDPSVLLEALRTAVESQILVVGSDGDGSDGDYAFRHALLQEAAYDDLLPGERQRLHGVFAAALAERVSEGGAVAAGRWAELAYHWSAARDDRHAFEASVRAGDLAARAFAFADARRHDERALELWSAVDDPVEVAGIDKVELLGRTATASWLSGDARRTVALRREAIAAAGPGADPIVVGTLLGQLGRALWTNVETEEALETSEAAVAIMPIDPPTAERARVLSGYGQLLMLLDRWTELSVLCEQAVAIARQVGARQVEGHALNTFGLDMAAAGRCGEAIPALREALEIAREVADADDIGRGYNNLVEGMRYCGDRRGALEVVREAILVTDQLGLGRTYGSFVRANGVAYAYEIGEWAEAARLAEEGVATQEAGRPQRRYGLARWILLLTAQGDERTGAFLAELGHLVEGFPVESQFHIPYRLAMAEAAIWRGDPDRALAEIRQGLREIRGHEWARHHARLFRIGMRAAADVAEIARARRDVPGEQAAIDAGEDLWRSYEPVLADLVGRQQGLAAEETAAETATIEAERARLRRESALDRWRLAANRWRAHDNPYLVGCCRWREAEAALGDGDRAAATEALVDARGIADRLGAAPLQAAIDGLAARARLDLSAAAPEVPVATVRVDDPFGLTRRERDVLPLLVKGWTNRQIAEALFISENTAGVHVSNILGKLDASTRTEAAAIAARLGLGGD